MRSQVAILIAVALVAGLAFFKTKTQAPSVANGSYTITKIEQCSASTWNTCGIITKDKIKFPDPVFGAGEILKLEIKDIEGVADCESKTSHVLLTTAGFIKLNLFDKDMSLSLSTTAGEKTSTTMELELPQSVMSGDFIETLSVLDINGVVLQCAKVFFNINTK